MDAYGQMKEGYERLIESEKGQALIRTLEEVHPCCGVTDLKKIDAILWQTR